MAKQFIFTKANLLFAPSFWADDDFVGWIEHFLQELPEYKPHKWNSIEPINKPFDLAAIRELISIGGNLIYWKRSSPPKSQGEFKSRAKAKPWHAHHSLGLTASSDAEIQAAIRYCESASQKFGIDYAHLDTNPDAYKDYGLICDASPFRDYIYIPSVKLHQNLPDIFWYQIFGPPYVRLFGLEKLLSAPAYRVAQIAEETICIQLSGSVFDMHTNYGAVDAVRQKVKAHIDNNIIFNSNNPPDHIYRIPDFQFPEKPKS